MEICLATAKDRKSVRAAQSGKCLTTYCLLPNDKNVNKLLKMFSNRNSYLFSDDPPRAY